MNPSVDYLRCIGLGIGKPRNLMILGEPKRLTRYNARFNSVVFSPDSQYIAVSCVVRWRCLVGLIHADGQSGSILLAGRENAIDDAYYDLQFSPDGTFLIACFAEEDGEFGDLCRIDIKTRAQTRLTHTRKVSRPCLSPNGRDIVFEEAQNGRRHLFRVSVEGGETTCLTAPAVTRIIIGGYACYSPDGSRIAFVASEREEDTTQPKEKRQIFVMDADGTNVAYLTRLPHDCGYPRWHPDGENVVFTVQTNYADGEKQARALWKYRTNFYVVNANRNKAKNEVPRSLEESHSVNYLDSLHPSGRWIACHSSCGERFQEGWRNWDIRVLYIETGQVLVVTDDDIYDTHPLFSPDGKSLLFVSERNNEKRHTSNAQNLMETQGSDLYLLDWK